MGTKSTQAPVAKYFIDHPNRDVTIEALTSGTGLELSQVINAVNSIVRDRRLNVTKVIAGSIYRYEPAPPPVALSPGMAEVVAMEKAVDAAIAEVDAAKSPAGVAAARWKLPNASVPSSRPLFEQVYAFPSGHVMLIDETGAHWRAEKIED